MDDFNTIRLKKNTIEKFKKYSKKVSPNYSETLDYMIAFFEDNYLSPYDTLSGPMWSLNKIINKRMDAVAAILRNMEKTQLIPAREMLESLFEREEEEEETLLVERNHFEEESLKSIDERLYSHYYNKYEATHTELSQLKNDLNNIIDNVKYMKNTFGRDYYRLDISKEKLEKIKLKQGK